MLELLKKWKRKNSRIQTPFYFPVKKLSTKERTAIVIFIFPQTEWVFDVISSWLNFSYQICVLLTV